MILIADSGGTKVEWCLLNGGEVMTRFTTPGMNALMLTEGEMAERLGDELMPQIEQWKEEVAEVYFYGAGCVSAAVCGSVRDAIARHIPNVQIEVSTDLLGASRALCGHHAGIVCILGTGSNSCFYNGQHIVENVSPLGFILGDEGSGAYLGKILVGDVLKRQLPEKICHQFLEETGLDAVSIVHHVYREPYPNKFLASLTPFLSKHIDEPSIRSLIISAFKAFFERNVCLYSNRSLYKVYFTGSIAYVFKDLLTEAAAWYGCVIGAVIRTPMDGLIKFHSN